MRSLRWSVLLAVGAAITLGPAAVAGTGSHGHRATAEGAARPHRARAGTASTGVTFRILPRPVGRGGNGPPWPTGPGGPASVASSDGGASVAVDADGGHSGGSWSGSGGNGSTGRGRHGRHASAPHGPRSATGVDGRAHRAVRPTPRRYGLPFTGGDIESAALTGVVALLAGLVAVWLASGRRLTRRRRRAPRSG